MLLRSIVLRATRLAIYAVCAKARSLRIILHGFRSLRFFSDGTSTSTRTFFRPRRQSVCERIAEYPPRERVEAGEFFMRALVSAVFSLRFSSPYIFIFHNYVRHTSTYLIK